MTDQEFQQYYDEYMQDIFARAGSKDDFTEEQFTEEMCEFLVDQAVIQSYESAFFKKTQHGIRIDAWDYDGKKRLLCLFICDYSPTDEILSLTQTDIDKYFKRAEKFFTKSISGEFYNEIEESREVYKVSRFIFDNKDKINKIQFILLSNGKLSSQFKGVEKRSIEGFQTVYDIWDISRRARIYYSGKSKEDIIIDFTKYVQGGIEFLNAYTGSEKCQSFLLVMPGTILSEIYDLYGERLLEQNVRTFLQFRGGVNKGIRNTIKNQPEMFFAYNNGLTITAEETTIKENRLLSIKNMQIVNGGQTTASIFMSKLQDKQNIDLNKVYVQIKLTIIDPERVDEIVPIISKCANTQNKVSAADFFSNHPYQKRIEDFSRRLLAPSAAGSMIESYWFYERARGQYANKQIKMTPAQKRKFLIQNPKHQMFTKTDLAKYENTFAQLPHYVSKGAQWNFGKFAEEICGKDGSRGLWDNNELSFNELYYKQLIARAIMFKSLDKLILNQNWYAGGYKAQIVTYTLAKLSQIIALKGKFINFLKIWKNQNISLVTEEQLLKLAKIINDVITDTDENVTQYCKKQICWQRVQEVVFPLSEDFETELIDSYIESDQKRDAQKTQKVLNDINCQIEVFNKGVYYWTKMIDWANKNNLFDEREMSILSTTLRMKTNPPSEKQCKVILAIEKKAVEEGFFFE